jgi:hypothetical protein
MPRWGYKTQETKPTLSGTIIARMHFVCFMFFIICPSLIFCRDFLYVPLEFRRGLTIQSRNPDMVNGFKHGLWIALRSATELRNQQCCIE